MAAAVVWVGWVAAMAAMVAVACLAGAAMGAVVGLVADREKERAAGKPAAQSRADPAVATALAVATAR